METNSKNSDVTVAEPTTENKTKICGCTDGNSIFEDLPDGRIQCKNCEGFLV